MSFANPAYLLALPLLAVPILLHLMQRQVPKLLVFPAIRFIKKASDSDQGRKRLKDLLTLLTRLLVLAALILFFAKPRITEPGSASSTADLGQVIVLVDCSASMSAGDLDGFVEKVLNEFAASRPDARFAAVMSSNRVVNERPWTSAESLMKQMASLKAEMVKGEHGPALSRVAELIGASKTTTCVVISDFQQSDWSLQQLESLDAISTLELRKMPSRLDANCAIISADHALYKRTNQKILVVNARVKNYSVSRKTIKLRLSQDGGSTESTVSLAGGGVQVVSLEVPAGQRTDARVEIVEDDGYIADNALALWTGDAPPARVALLTPERQSAGLERFFLEKALLLKQAGRRTVVMKSDGNSQMGDNRFNDLDVIISLDTIPSDLAALKKWVEQGKRFIYFAGPDALNTIGNLNLGGIIKTRALGLHGDHARLESIYIDGVKTSDPLLEPFAKSPGDLNQFPIFRYVGFQADKSADSLIQLQNKSDLLIHERLGLGDVYVFGIGILPMWSEFPTSRSFVPIVRQLVEEPVNDRQLGVKALAVGDALPTSLLDKGALPELSSKVGVFLVDGEPVVVNVDRVESNPDVLDVDAIAPGGGDLLPDAGTEATTAGNGTVTDLSMYMAGLALLGVLLELIAANSQLFFKRG